MTARQILTCNRGVATSLIETVMVIAIAATLMSMAIMASMDKVEDARLTRAIADTETIGIAVHSFMHDTGFAPAFKKGSAHSPNDEIYQILESAGDNPTAVESLNWPADETARDRIENHLIMNKPGGTTFAYLRMGEVSYARTRGWNGPYLPSLPSSDPWGNRYLVNVQLLTPKGIQMAAGSLSLGVGQRPAVFVISSGQNRILDTNYFQTADEFMPAGDDIIYRIQ
jgi:type II secretory pathway pseudopilin PulG